MGHKSPDCPIENAKKARETPRASSPEARKSPALKNYMDTQSVDNLGMPWAPYYTFSVVPKSTIPSSSHQSRHPQIRQPPPAQPPVLVPSNFVWDKTRKEYVNTPSHYYYKTRHTSVFNNLNISAPASFSAQSNSNCSP